MKHAIPSKEKKNNRPAEDRPGPLRFLLLISAALFIAFCGRPTDTASKPVEQEKPAVVQIGPVAPDIIGVTIRAGRVEYGRQGPYTQEKGDSISQADGGNCWILGKARRSALSSAKKAR